MNADITCQHLCVHEEVFVGVSGSKVIQHSLSSYYGSCSTCPSTQQQTKGLNFREFVPTRELETNLRSFAFSPSPSLHFSCQQQPVSRGHGGPGCWPGPIQLCEVPLSSLHPPPRHFPDCWQKGYARKLIFQRGLRGTVWHAALFPLRGPGPLCTSAYVNSCVGQCASLGRRGESKCMYLEGRGILSSSYLNLMPPCISGRIHNLRMKLDYIS